MDVATAHTLEELAEAFAAAIGRPVEPEPIAFGTFAERMGGPESFARFLERRTSQDVDTERLAREFEFEPTALGAYLDREWTVT